MNSNNLKSKLGSEKPQKLHGYELRHLARCLGIEPKRYIGMWEFEWVTRLKIKRAISRL